MDVTMTDTTTRRPAIPCKICRDGRGRHPVYSSMDDRKYGHPEGYLCNDCADHAPTSMVEITPEGEEVPGIGKPGPHPPPIGTPVYAVNQGRVTRPRGYSDESTNGRRESLPFQVIGDDTQMFWVLDLADPAEPTRAEIEAGREITHLLSAPPQHELDEMFAPGEGFLRVDNGPDVPVTIDGDYGITSGSFQASITADDIARIYEIPKWLLRIGEYQSPYPRHAADRTVSPRRAAGSRRTKRHARRRQ